MPIEQQCTNCVHYKSGAYGKKCSYFGRVPSFDGANCEEFEEEASLINTEENASIPSRSITDEDGICRVEVDEQWPEQCQSCRKLKICKEYSVPPTYSTCPNYLSVEVEDDRSVDAKSIAQVEDYPKGGVRMDDYYPDTIDSDHYPKLKWLSGLCLFAGIWTVFIGFIDIIFNYGGALHKVLEGVSAIYFLLLGCYTYFSIRKRKPAAIYYSRFMMLVCILSWLISFATGSFKFTAINIFFGLSTLVYGGFGLYLTFTNDEVREVFPREYRKTKWKDYLFTFGYILLPFIIVGLVVLTSVGITQIGTNRKAPNHLKETIENVNAKCPIDVGYWKTTSVKYEDNIITFDYLVNESVLAIDIIEKNKEKITTLSLKKNAAADDGGFIKEIINEKASLKSEYIGNSTGRVVSVLYDYKKIKECVKDSYLNDKEYVQLAIDLQKQLLPMNVDEITELSDIYIKDKNVHYIYNIKNIDESELDGMDFDYLKTASLLKIRHLLFVSSDLTFSKMVNLGYGTQYDYKINSKHLGSFIISTSEISYALQHPLSEAEYEQECLLALVKKVNKNEVPYKIDKGFVLESVGVENNNLVYNYVIDDYLYELSALKSKKVVEESFVATDLQTHVGTAAVSCNKGFSYHFTGKRSGKTVIVDFSFSEIDSLLNN